MIKEKHKKDHDLVQACLAGDVEASDRLVRQALDQVRRVLYRVLGPDSEYEDHVQETMYQILKSLSRFRATASLRTWVTRITVNQARQILRKRRRRPIQVSMDAAGEFSNLDPGPERATQDAELRRALYEIMDRLDVDKRLAVALYELAGLSMAEVADATGVTRSTAKSRVWFGRKYLLEAAALHPTLADWLEGSGQTQAPSSRPAAQSPTDTADKREGMEDAADGQGTPVKGVRHPGPGHGDNTGEQ